MTPLTIVLDLTIQSPVDPARARSARITHVCALPGGMQSGKPSVAIIAELDDGTQVFAETSLALLQAAARAFTAKYGEAGE